METQNQEWKKSYVIERVGKLFRVRSKDAKRPLDELFTDMKHAQDYVTAIQQKQFNATVNKKIKAIKNSGDDIKKRMKDYKKLCQDIQDNS